MSVTELILIAVGLSMDAFAVAICQGLASRRFKVKSALAIAFAFGLFQALMPMLGWALGTQFADYITAYDHWVAFVLLAIIGGKMIYDALIEKQEDAPQEEKLSLRKLLLLAIATSIDALAVGVSFAFLKVNIAFSTALIGVITFTLSFAGVWIGNKFGAKYKSKAELAGGVILVLIGVKILLEHLQIIHF